MSISLMTLVWKIPFPTSTQMVIALKLADHADDDGSKIYPGRASLADRARCSESTVKATLKLFREAGILVVLEEGGKGPRHTTKYMMNVGLLEAIASGHVSISGGSETIELFMMEDGVEKGAISDPLEIYPVSPLAVRGQPTGRKGSASPPQTFTNHQEPSLSAGAPATLRAARPSIEVKAGDISWLPWLETIERNLGVVARSEVARRGKVFVAARWPRDDIPMPRVEVIRDPTGEAA